MLAPPAASPSPATAGAGARACATLSMESIPEAGVECSRVLVTGCPAHANAPSGAAVHVLGASSSGDRATAASPPSESIPQDAGSCTPLAETSNASRRWTVIHSGFDELVPPLFSLLVTRYITWCDAMEVLFQRRTGMRLRTPIVVARAQVKDVGPLSLPFQPLMDVASDAVRHSFSAYCPFGSSALTSTLAMAKKSVLPAPRVAEWLSTLRALPLPLQPASAAAQDAATPLTVRTSRRVRTFVLTNSSYNHASILLNAAYGNDWQSLFDLIIVDARKKSFFNPTPPPSALQASAPGSGSAWGGQLPISSARPGGTRASLVRGASAQSLLASQSSSSTSFRPVNTRTGRIMTASDAITVRPGGGVPSSSTPGISRPASFRRQRIGSSTSAATSPVDPAAASADARSRAPSILTTPEVLDLSRHTVFSGGTVAELRATLEAYAYLPAPRGAETSDSSPAVGRDAPPTPPLPPLPPPPPTPVRVCYMGDHLLQDVLSPVSVGWSCVAVWQPLTAAAAFATGSGLPLSMTTMPTARPKSFSKLQLRRSRSDLGVAVASM
ncbi:hypothetical protein EON62_03405, partial [archaeon]